MGMKLFDDDEEVQNADVSKIEIDKEFARRYEHNKKREALQRFEELKKKGQIEESDSESSDEEDDADLIKLVKKEHLQKLFENLNKVKKRDPSLYSENGKFFESDSDSDGDRKEKIEIRDSKKKPKYLKDVTAQQLLEEGPEFEDGESSKKKTYNEEQEELKKAFLDAVKDAEEDGEGDLLKVKENKNGNEEEVDDDDDGEFEKKLGEYFGPEGELDENNKFLKEFFEKQMWVDKGTKDRSSFVEDDEMDELLRDEEEIEKQDKYEESYNFRYEENAGDRVMGHSRKVEGSVRKKENARKEQRKSKEERMKIAEMERKEELKHLKNLKKKEMKERMMKVMEAAGIRDDNDFALDLDDLEEDFDPAEYDKMMKKAFGEKYYNADDMDPEFGSDNDADGADIVKPDFDKEDELLGLPKGWDAVENQDGFLAARDRFLKRKAENGGEEEEEEGEVEEEDKEVEEEEEEVEEEEEEEREEMGNAVEQNEDSKRKRKRKMSLVKKVKEEMMEEYYKLDYEGTIGDLKTRFKYAKVNPNRYGLKTEEILMLDDKELNQYVSVKKFVPYREREWKVPNNKRFQYKMSIRELLRGRLNHSKSSKKNRSKDDGKSTSVVGSHQDGKAELEGSNAEMDKLSRQAKRRHRQKELKLPPSRLAAYQNIQPKAKGKGKH